ncbi:NAD(P)-binding protein [Meredithblackwellia eburnea MCA 4105]
MTDTNIIIKISTLLTGATGFIGGTLLKAILAHNQLSAQLDITAIFRKNSDNEKLKTLGIKTVQADLSKDYTLVSQLANQSQLVIDVAHSDTSVNAILQGFKLSKEQRKQKPTFIHTSGTGVLSDDSMGMFQGQDFYDDTNLDDLKRISPEAWHRDVDLSIYEADTTLSLCNSYIVYPALVYGIGTGTGQRESQQIPKLVDIALERGEAGMIGEGKSIRGSVHINDLVNLYLLLLTRVLSPTPPPSGWHGSFFGASSSQTWLSLSQSIGKHLHSLGHLPSSKVSSLTEEEMQRMIGDNAGKFLASNSRPVARRAIDELGWEPREASVGECIGGDVDYHLKVLGLSSSS